MKISQTLGAILALALAAQCHAQTFVQLRITPQQTNAVLSVPTNTLARFWGGIGSASGWVYVTNSGFAPALIGNAAAISPEAVLGPCDIALYLTNTGLGESNWFCQVLIELRPVNTLPAPGVVYSLETSTNLATWQTITNASFPASDRQRFFRSSLKLP